MDENKNPPEPKWLKFKLHPKWHIREAGYRCSQCNAYNGPDHEAFSVDKHDTDRLGYICRKCYDLLSK
ncbi:hypothetical protein LCGC14_0175770 [marine sediment metagenome]|uniref:Uncharacterized protein n=1 Tax=marine sediment metagenome TaxID=412755 RepID=A0A0F9XTT3_9ZZZZ